MALDMTPFTLHPPAARLTVVVVCSFIAECLFAEWPLWEKSISVSVWNLCCWLLWGYNLDHMQSPYYDSSLSKVFDCLFPWLMLSYLCLLVSQPALSFHSLLSDCFLVFNNSLVWIHSDVFKVVPFEARLWGLFWSPAVLFLVVFFFGFSLN